MSDKLKNIYEYENKNDLLGRKVYISNRNNSEIATIDKVMKTGFRVSTRASSIFSYHGSLKGGDAWNQTYAELITDEQEKAIREKKRQQSVMYGIKSIIRSDLDKYSYEKLIQIKTLIDQP